MPWVPGQLFDALVGRVHRRGCLSRLWATAVISDDAVNMMWGVACTQVVASWDWQAGSVSWHGRFETINGRATPGMRPGVA